MEIIRYSSIHKEAWDTVVDASKNGTFLHRRDFMDYHCDRFDDCSLMCVDDKGRLMAVLPANRRGDTLYSHQGLTYGGWIIPVGGFTVATMLEVWRLMNEFARELGIAKIVYKAVPHIYHRYPAEEDIYAIFRNGGRLSASFISAAMPLNECRVRFNENARRGMRHAVAQGVEVGVSADFASYWGVLSQMLHERYGTAPVHSLEEMELLHSRFPENIKLYVATHNGEVVAGVVMFFTHMVAHAQYIAASPRGKELKALPLVFDYIIGNECGDCQYFDFGTSNEDNGMYLNEGLITQKCGMGGRGIVYNIYELGVED